MPLINFLQNRTRIAASTALLAVLFMPAYGENKDKDHNDAFVNGAPNESHIAKEVRHQLVTLPYYGVFDDLAFQVNGGTVVLLGQVTRPTLKSDAQSAVKSIDGVQNVVNNIEVL